MFYTAGFMGVRYVQGAYTPGGEFYEAGKGQSNSVVVVSDTYGGVRRISTDVDRVQLLLILVQGSS